MYEPVHAACTHGILWNYFRLRLRNHDIYSTMQGFNQSTFYVSVTNMCNNLCVWCNESAENPVWLRGEAWHENCLATWDMQNEVEDSEFDDDDEFGPDDERFDGPNDYPLEDSMDGDFDSGMASAGFGTDEDYGGYGHDEDVTDFGLFEDF